MSKEREALKLALEALEASKRTHHYCEDTWYSCPKHEDGCANESEGAECNCGADEANAQLDKAITAIREALAEQPVQTLPFGVGGGLVAIKTLLNRDPCAHAKVAIEMIDSMLTEQPAPPPECQTEAEKTAFAFGWWKALESVRQPTHVAAVDTSSERVANQAQNVHVQPAQQWTDETAKVPDHVWDGMWKALEQKRKADSALDRMAENARELGLDYEPPCKTGSQCTSKCPQCDEPAQHQPNIESYLEKDNLQPAQQQEPEYKGWYCAHCQRGVDGSEVTYREQHQCSRSHPHENMDAMCELRTEIARLTNENARLKARHQDDEINTYRMTLLCIRDGLQKGMSKSIQKLQAREINDVLGLPSFASYRTSPPIEATPLASQSRSDVKPWVPLTEFDIDQIPYSCSHADSRLIAFAIEAKLREKNTGEQP